MPSALGVPVKDATRKPRGGNYPACTSSTASRLSTRRRPGPGSPNSILWTRTRAAPTSTTRSRCQDCPRRTSSTNNRSFTCPYPGNTRRARRSDRRGSPSRSPKSTSASSRRQFFGSRWRASVASTVSDPLVADSGAHGVEEHLWVRRVHGEPCQTPRRDPDVRIPWSKAAGLEKGRVAAGEAIAAAASLRLVRRRWPHSSSSASQRRSVTAATAQGPDKASGAAPGGPRSRAARATGRAALDPNAHGVPRRRRRDRDRLLLPPDAPRRARRRAGERHEAAGRGPAAGGSFTRGGQPGCTREGRGCSTWKASLPAPEELLFAPLRRADVSWTSSYPRTGRRRQMLRGRVVRGRAAPQQSRRSKHRDDRHRKRRAARAAGRPDGVQPWPSILVFRRRAVWTLRGEAWCPTRGSTDVCSMTALRRPAARRHHDVARARGRRERALP